ncbi:unnamed protein product [Prorocentrum cordatum]|uniref:Uncharacterized protein n=1 Tax=Prorocentrum cordatum TaxID=2364126 RepID=A0ABN9UW96_9DINO|nr:unnamed protein product [Polarella glacialis]
MMTGQGGVPVPPPPPQQPPSPAPAAAAAGPLADQAAEPSAAGAVIDEMVAAPAAGIVPVPCSPARDPAAAQNLSLVTGLRRLARVEGLELCRRRPPEHFLSRLGATGSSYEARAAWWHWWEPDGTAPAMRVGEAAEDAPCLEGGAARRMLSSSTSCCQRMNAHQCSTPRGVLTPWAAHAPRAAAGARPVVVAVPCGSGAVLPAPPWRQLPAKPVAAVTLRPRGQPWPARPGGA